MINLKYFWKSLLPLRKTIIQTIRKSPDTPDKSGEIYFGLVKYFNFFLINTFKFLQYKSTKMSGKL